MVFDISNEYLHLIPELENKTIVQKGVLGHDLIEDARVSYNDIKELVGYEVAEIIFLCTENKGRNRLARKSKEFYEDLATNELAVFVKLCDIIANSTFSKQSGSSMFSKYQSEWTKVKQILYTDKYKEIFDELDKLYQV
jgi:(p)ppGpp synthase/HD superfamily hydrolase